MGFDERFSKLWLTTVRGELTYRGEDRRAPTTWASPGGRQFNLAVALLGALTASLVALAVNDPTPPEIDLHALNGLVATACAVLAFVAGCVSFLRWRMVGTASSLRAGAALVLLGALTTVVVLVPMVMRSSPSSRQLLRLDSAMVLTVSALFAVAVVAPPIDARVSAARRAAGVIVAITVLFLLQYALSALEWFGRTTTPPISGPGDVAANVGIVTLWVLLALISLARGIRCSSWLWTWLGLMLWCFAIAGVFCALASEDSDLWATGALVLRLLGLLFVLNGVSQELKLAYIDQRARLFDTRVSAEASELRRRAELAEREERAHEAGSALLGIQAATRTLAAGYDGFATETQRELRVALEAEIELLRRLVAGERGDELCEAFDVAEAITPVVTCQRAAGCDIRCRLGTEIRALGRPAVLTEIVQSLLDNAHEHAPASPVVVVAAREGNRVAVRVEDRGPGVAPEHGDRIFDRGFSSSASGSGLGLYVAHQLLRDQGGDIRVEDRPGGGASFVVTLPAASLRGRTADRAELVHQPDHSAQLGDEHPFDAAGRDQ